MIKKLTLLCLSVCFSLLQAATVPHFDHVLVVIEENHSYSAIVGSSSAPYMNSLISQGALFTNSFCIGHPSQPNYLAIFSGSTQGVTDDNVHPKFNAPCLGAQLIAANKTFIGYSEYLPFVGYNGAASGNYVRKHNPWTQFTTLSESTNQPFTNFPADFTNLPSLCFVVPGLNDDAHNGTVEQADAWLEKNLNAYAQWAITHNSLLIVTFDENGSGGTNIPTFFYGAHVKIGHYNEHINHYNVLRTMEDIFGLSYLRKAAKVSTITDVWD